MEEFKNVQKQRKSLGKALLLRQEGREEGITIKRMKQPLRRTGFDRNCLELTRLKMAEIRLPVDLEPHYALIVIH